MVRQRARREEERALLSENGSELLLECLDGAAVEIRVPPEPVGPGDLRQQAGVLERGEAQTVTREDDLAALRGLASER